MAPALSALDSMTCGKAQSYALALPAPPSEEALPGAGQRAGLDPGKGSNLVEVRTSEHGLGRGWYIRFSPLASFRANVVSRRATVHALG